MGRSYTSPKRREDIRVRVANPEHAYAACVVIGCGQPTMAKQRSGLNKNYCRRHVEHFRRHGSYAKKSYTAAELAPYRRAALGWLKANRGLPEVEEALARVRDLYWRAGRPEEAFRLAGKSPSDRAKYVWGRLDSRQVCPAYVLSAWIAVSLRHGHDPQPERRIEYRLVQAAKLLHRMAGGSHKRWKTESPEMGVEVVELHKHPASRGRSLRHVGVALARACEPISRRLSDIGVPGESTGL